VFAEADRKVEVQLRDFAGGAWQSRDHSAARCGVGVGTVRRGVTDERLQAIVEIPRDPCHTCRLLAETLLRLDLEERRRIVSQRTAIGLAHRLEARLRPGVLPELRRVAQRWLGRRDTPANRAAMNAQALEAVHAAAQQGLIAEADVERILSYGAVLFPVDGQRDPDEVL
jgi:hypothetical protein